MLKKYGMPLAVRACSLPVLNKLPAKIEALGAALQSKRGGGFDAEWQEVTNALQFITRPEPLLFDIGANRGHWTATMRKIGGDKPTIVMFEPQPACWPRVEKLVDEKTSLEKCAMSDHSGMLPFFVAENTEIAAAHARTDFNDAFRKVEVPCSTLDAYVAGHTIAFIDFVKMDIEGHEMHALKGAMETLRQHKIGAISFEFGQANVNSRTFFVDYYQFLTELGYTLYRVAHDGVPVALKGYSRSQEYFGGVANYIASITRPKRQRREP